MARIPEVELERLKREVSLVRLIEAKGVRLEKRGADLVGLCPFHEDREPSLVVSPEKNLWHCLGACGVGGSVVDWVMRAEGVSFRHAVELLKEREKAAAKGEAGREEGPGPVPKRSTVVKLPTPFVRTAADDELLHQVVGYYHASLKDSPEALGYLEQRGLRSGEMIERFKLGYSNRTLCYRLPQKKRVAGAELRGRLQRLGLLRESGHEHFRGSLVIPVFDAEGRVVEMYGRKVGSGLRAGTPEHVYLPGPLRGVWNLEAVASSPELILCEALIDALTFWCAGMRNVTAAYGVNGLTEEHLRAFAEHGTKRIWIAYDRDEAGERAAAELAPRLIARGIECYRVQFPKGMDANEYALKVEPAERSLEVVVRSAIWMDKAREEGMAAAQEAAEGAEDQERARAAAKGKPSDQEEARTAAIPLNCGGTADTAEGERLEPGEAAVPSSSPEPSTPATTAPPAPASSEPFPLAAPPPDPVPPPAAEAGADEVVLRFGDRRWRVRGLPKNLSFDQIRVNVLVGREAMTAGAAGNVGAGGFHVDTFDLYSAKQRAVYVKQAAEELGVKEEVIKKDLGKVLLRLEELQEAQIKRAMEPAKKDVVLGDEEQAAALEVLRDPDLLGRILRDFETCGVVGEETNKLVGYLAAVSRKLTEPLAVVIQSSSSAGKTALMEAVLAFVPSEERVQYSAMTGQSLFYMGETDLQHKILAIVEEEGAERASYALKLLQSEGELTIASTGKDPETGRLITHEYHVKGPVMIFLTTTAIEVDEELLNRCLVLTVSEDREQTRRIHRLQRSRQTLEGLLLRQDREEVLKLHQDAQRLLRPLLVANPYAPELTFQDGQIRTRRDHMKYLTLIRTIALLHQHQRPVKTVMHNGKSLEYLEVTRADIEMANRLAHEVLGRSLDELPPHTRKLLELLDGMVAEGCKKLGMDRADYRFTRRQVREATGWGNTQLKLHLERLADMEYLAVYPKGQAYAYELLYDGQGQAGRPFLSGLIDAEKLETREYDGNRSGSEADRSGQKGDRSGTGRGVVGPWSGGGRGVENAVEADEHRPEARSRPKPPETALKGAGEEGRSYVLEPSYAQAANSPAPFPLAACPGPGGRS